MLGLAIEVVAIEREGGARRVVVRTRYGSLEKESAVTVSPGGNATFAAAGHYCVTVLGAGDGLVRLRVAHVPPVG